MKVIIWSVLIYRAINIVILIKPNYPTTSTKHSNMATKNDMKWCWVLLTPWIKDDGSLVKNKNKTFPIFGQINSWECRMHPSAFLLWLEWPKRTLLSQANTTFNMFTFKQSSHQWCTFTFHLPWTAWRGQTPHGMTSAGWLQPLAVRVRSHVKISSSEKASFVSPPDKRRGWAIAWNSPCLGCTSGEAE